MALPYGRRLPSIAAFITGCVLVFIWFRVPSSSTTSHEPTQERQKQVPVVTNVRRMKSGTCNIDVSLTEKEEKQILDCTTGFKAFRHDNRLINHPKMERERVDSHSYLNSDSRVLEVGGFKGVDAAKLIKKYDPYYMAMEPIPSYQKILEERYKDNPKFRILNFGLGKENKTLILNIDSDATSLFREKKKSAATTQEIAHIREITQFFRELEVETQPLDLITINCEGCEYELLELLLSSKIVKNLKNIQFQFHLDLPGVANQECRYCQIMTLLSRTHKPTFQFSYTWQCWKLLTK